MDIAKKIIITKDDIYLGRPVLPSHFFERLGASGSSQLASTEDSGGVSAVIGTPDLNVLTVVSGHALRQ